MSERKYTDEEVAAIFERATAAQPTGQRQLPSREGMTLSQIQEIGREVGIAPEDLAQAAHSMELSGQSTSRRFLGLPIGVGLSVELDRKLSDEEWERFVVDLRETFDARGTLTEHGSFRQWTNGNLQALLEPGANGHRIRFRTIKGDAPVTMGVGIAMFGFATIAATFAALRGGFSDLGALVALGMLGTAGVAMFGIAGLRLPGWSRLRRKQMEELAARLRARIT